MPQAPKSQTAPQHLKAPPRKEPTSRDIKIAQRSLMLFPPPKCSPGVATIKPMLEALLSALNMDMRVLEKRTGLADYALGQPQIPRTTAVRITRYLMAEYLRQVKSDTLIPRAAQRRFLARTLLKTAMIHMVGHEIDAQKRLKVRASPR